jgi:phosphoenolpyruvate synthase/pyruvate phosphate dikinase
MRRSIDPPSVPQQRLDARAVAAATLPELFGRSGAGRRLVQFGPIDAHRAKHYRAGFQPGEILLARATAPAWTPLFARAVAVITDGGAITSHASIVAREYGIPAVVGTGDATHRFVTGQWVTVDGSTGIVHTTTPTST